MSADREQDHLEMMSNMVDRHHNQPAAYFDAYDFDGNDQNGGVPCEGNGERLLVESPSTISAMEWIRSGAPVPTERPEVIAGDLYRKKFNLAPRRL